MLERDIQTLEPINLQSYTLSAQTHHTVSYDTTVSQKRPALGYDTFMYDGPKWGHFWEQRLVVGVFDANAMADHTGGECSWLFSFAHCCPGVALCWCSTRC